MEERVVAKMPWWGISVMVHVSIFLILTTIAAFTVTEHTVEVLIVSPPNVPIEPIIEDKEEKPINIDLDRLKPTEEQSKIEMNFDKDTEEKPDESLEEKMKGTSLDNHELTDYRGTGFNDAIGGGTGPAGSYGWRKGALRPHGKGKRGIPGGTFNAIVEALKWLARHQNADGSWSTTHFSNNCSQFGYAGQCVPNEFNGKDQFDVGNTGLALLAFLGAGYTPADKTKIFPESSLTYGQVVKRGLKYLISVQDASGRIGPDVDKYMYNHAIAALALVEAYGMTNLANLHAPARKSVEFLIKAKNPGFGWRYVSQSGDTDSSVTGWAVMVLKSAEIAGLSFDRAVYSDVKRWYDDCTKEVDYNSIDSRPNSSAGTSVGNLVLTGYKGSGDAGKLVAVRGVNDQYFYTPALTAIMIMSTVFIEKQNIGKAARAVDSLMSFLPQKWSPQDRNSWRAADMYYWYYASYALFQVTKDSDPKWKRWNKAMETALLETQNLSGFEGQCKRGSWEPVDRWSCEGGRVYTTAMGALTLEVYFRYTKVLQEKSR